VVYLDLLISKQASKQGFAYLLASLGLLKAAVYAYKEGRLKTGLWIGRLEDAESLDYIMRSLDRLHGCRALTERLHSQSLDRLSADVEPTDAEPRSYVQQKTP